MSEQHQIAFLANRNYATVNAVLVKQWFSRPIVASSPGHSSPQASS